MPQQQSRLPLYLIALVLIGLAFWVVKVARDTMKQDGANGSAKPRPAAVVVPASPPKIELPTSSPAPASPTPAPPTSTAAAASTPAPPASVAPAMPTPVIEFGAADKMMSPADFAEWKRKNEEATRIMKKNTPEITHDDNGSANPPPGGNRP